MNQQELKSFAHYDPETGNLTRTHAPCNSVKAGEEIGWTQIYSGGLHYRCTEYQGRQYFVHRLAFLYMTGKFPKKHIDHEDGDGLNNKWNNLREATRTENLRNRKLNVNNKSGHIGVSFYQQTGKWRAAINANGKKIHLGYFDSKEDAKRVRLKAQRQFNYHDNHGRKDIN